MGRCLCRSEGACAERVCRGLHHRRVDVVVREGMVQPEQHLRSHHTPAGLTSSATAYSCTLSIIPYRYSIRTAAPYR